MKFKDLTIFAKDAPVIDSITDQEGNRWLLTCFAEDIQEISEFRECGTHVVFQSEDFESFTVKADDEVAIDKFGSLILEDDEARFMLDFYPASKPINLVPQKY